MKSWWEKYPDRLDFEILELKDAGILCELDKTALAEGAVVLHLVTEVEGYPGLKLRVVYPEFYPEFPFEIEAPDLNLAHHQNPFEKNLCFLDNPGENWAGAKDTVARFIQDRLPTVLRAANTDQKNSLESPRSEPFSNFISFDSGSMVFFDSSWVIPTEECGGRLIIGITEKPNNGIFRGAVLEVHGRDGIVLATAANELSEIYKSRFTGRWVRFDKPPVANDKVKIYEQAVSFDKRLGKPLANKWDTDIIGILFPEETKWRENGDGWLFLSKTTKNNRYSLLMARGGRAGKADIQGRNPALRGLENKKVAVFGLGCLGAPSALEFAKAGVGELRLLDNDYVEPGTIVRWPFGLQSAAGKDKSHFLSHMIAADYPFTKVMCAVCRLGKAQLSSASNNDLSERAVLTKILDGIDLIYDATAELTINRLLSSLAAERGIPYILVAGTPGMWGGRIVRIKQGEGQGCWSCYRHATMEGEIPSPMSDEVNGLVAPEGCSAPTFTGTSFDASEISMGGVRLAVSTLMEDISGGYPATPWDVAIVNLRDKNGASVLPQWQSHHLAKHQKCHCEHK